MTSQTNERALEKAIEKSLTGFCTEELNAGSVTELDLPYASNGYFIGRPIDFNAKYVIDEFRFWFSYRIPKQKMDKLRFKQ